jgi:hypothetical protein
MFRWHHKPRPHQELTVRGHGIVFAVAWSGIQLNPSRGGRQGSDYTYRVPHQGPLSQLEPELLQGGSGARKGKVAFYWRPRRASALCDANPRACLPPKGLLRRGARTSRDGPQSQGKTVISLLFCGMRRKLPYLPGHNCAGPGTYGGGVGAV